MLMPNLTPHRSPEPLTPQSRACVCAAPIYREIGRDEPVFLSARLLAYTSMEPNSECHLMRSWCWYRTSPLLSSQPPHTAIARLCLHRSTERSAEMTPSFYHRACSHIPLWSLTRFRVKTRLRRSWRSCSKCPPYPRYPLSRQKRNREILKPNMTMLIRSGPILIDKVVSIYHLSQFRE